MITYILVYHVNLVYELYYLFLMNYLTYFHSDQYLLNIYHLLKLIYVILHYII